MNETLIIVPLKDPGTSKTRLSGTLTAAARRRLTRALYKRTLEFLKPIAKSVAADLAVVTASEEACDLARTYDVAVIDEPLGSGLSAAVTHAAVWAADHGYQRICVIPADLAAPLKQDVLALLGCKADTVICPSADNGTNALVVTPPDAIRFRYGPQSADLHLREAKAVGIGAVLMPLESLGFDIDTSDCLAKAVDRVPEVAEIFA